MKKRSAILGLNLLVALVFQSPSVFAVSDVIGTAGDFSRNGSQGAIANRQMADQMYKQALADHDAAWSKFPPNVALLSKALTLSKEAKLADDQAKEFARGALHGIHTGGNSGDFKLKAYGVASEKELNNLANSSSPHMGQVEKTLGGYGMKLSADKMSIKTPFGSLPLDMSLSALEKGVRTIATTLGYSADDVSKGIQEAVKTREAIAARTMAALNKNLEAGKDVGLASSERSDGGQAEGAGATVAATDTLSGAVGAGVDGPASASSIDQRQEELQRNRAVFLQKMGVHSGDPIGKPNQDIFKMIHLRYQALRSVGEFFEGDIPIHLTDSASVKAPAAKGTTRSPAAVKTRTAKNISQR